MDKEQGSQMIVHKDYLVQRNIEVEMILEPGQYLVVPRTTGCQLKRPENADQEQINLIDTKGEMNVVFESTLADIFKKFDLVVNNTIDFKEFKGFSDILSVPLKNEEEFKKEVLGKFNSY
jgi:hypothetical protein